MSDAKLGDGDKVVNKAARSPPPRLCGTCSLEQYFSVESLWTVLC